jgi:predicted ester cyclase
VSATSGANSIASLEPSTDRQSASDREMGLEALVQIIVRFEHAFRANDQATIDELCDPSMIDHNAPDGDPTLAAFKKKVAYIRVPFADLAEDLQDIIANGDTVATRWLLTGSLQKDFMGIVAAGQEIRVEGMNFYHLKNGRVTETWTQFDGATMMQQLNTAA